MARDLAPLVSARQEYFTAAELAEIATARGVTSFPTTRRGVNILIEREGWNDLPSRMARPRQQDGRGRAATEYHVSILPEIMQRTLAGSAAKSASITRVISVSEASQRRLAALKASLLPVRSRTVMEARAEVLTSVEGFAAAHGQSRAWAITQFAHAVRAWAQRQEIEARRDAGAILTDEELLSLGVALLLSSDDGFGLSAERLAVANDRSGRPAISRTTLYDWFKARDASGVLALAPVPPKEQQPIPAEFADFLRFYAKPGKPGVKKAYKDWTDDLAKRGRNSIPLSLSQCTHIVRERLNNVEKYVGREGILTLRSRLAYVTRTDEDMLPTTIYSGDGKTFDAEIADPVTKRPIRPEITTIIDIVTRKIVGISLSRSENQRSVAEALRNSCCNFGIPAIFYVDRGPGYRNDAMDADVGGLMGRLGITKYHALAYGSQAKGRIERVNRTVWNDAARSLPTYIGADMDKEAGQKIHKLTRGQLKEFGVSVALPSWETFVSLCEKAVAEYNDTPHRSLPKFADPETGRQRHMSPNECWQAHVDNGFEPVPVDPDEADDLFRPYEIRTASRCQVTWNNNQYFDDALNPYHEKKVMVGYDYHQADRVWVRELDLESGQPGKLICVARFGANSKRYVPQSYEQKALENRAKGRLRRLDDKRATVEAERDEITLIEHQVTEVADFIDLTPEPAPVALAIDNATDAPPSPTPRRKTFASDVDLAAWAMEHPDELIPGQITVLRGCLSRPMSRENLRANGIDTEALRDLLRAVSSQTEMSGTKRA